MLEENHDKLLEKSQKFFLEEILCEIYGRFVKQSLEKFAQELILIDKLLKDFLEKKILDEHLEEYQEMVWNKSSESFKSGAIFERIFEGIQGRIFPWQIISSKDSSKTVI